MLIDAVSASYSLTDWTGELTLLATEKARFGTQNGRNILRLPGQCSRLLQSGLLARKCEPPRNRNPTTLATSVELPYLPRRRHFGEKRLDRSLQAMHPPDNVCWWPATLQTPGTCRSSLCLSSHPWSDWTPRARQLMPLSGKRRPRLEPQQAGTILRARRPIP